MVFVKAQPGDTSDSLIRKFTRKVLSEGILQDLKTFERTFKPGLITALWGLDELQIQSNVSGIVQVPIIVDIGQFYLARPIRDFIGPGRISFDFQSLAV